MTLCICHSYVVYNCLMSLNRSQLLYFVMASYLVFNWFRLVVGVTFDWSCDRNVMEVVTADFDPAENNVIFNKTQVIT